MTQKIVPYLWFDGQAEEAAAFYTAIFPRSRITEVVRYADVGMDRPGAMSLTFELDGQRFHALNGGPQYRFTPAISLFVSCEDQAEVDRCWDALTGDGGRAEPCGWLRDKFGVSWQIVPRRLMELLADPDKGKAARVAQAMLKMSRIEIGPLEAAAAGAP